MVVLEPSLGEVAKLDFGWVLPQPFARWAVEPLLDLLILALPQGSPWSAPGGGWVVSGWLVGCVWLGCSESLWFCLVGGACVPRQPTCTLPQSNKQRSLVLVTPDSLVELAGCKGRLGAR